MYGSFGRNKFCKNAFKHYKYWNLIGTSSSKQDQQNRMTISKAQIFITTVFYNEPVRSAIGALLEHYTKQKPSPSVCETNSDLGKKFYHTFKVSQLLKHCQNTHQKKHITQGLNCSRITINDIQEKVRRIVVCFTVVTCEKHFTSHRQSVKQIDYSVYLLWMFH